MSALRVCSVKVCACITAGLALVTGIATADGPADWKVYAFTAGKQQVALFYLNNEIVRSNGHVQVWIKALNEQKLEGSHLDGKGEAFQAAVDLVGHYYIPPISTVTKLTIEQVAQLTLFEQIADEGSITPTLRILYEIDCGQKVMRSLSIIGEKPGSSDNRVHDWEHIPPESTMEKLAKLTCNPA